MFKRSQQLHVLSSLSFFRNKLLDEEDSDWHDVHGVVVETAIAAVLGHLGGRLDTGKVGDTIAWAALQIDVSISLSLADAIENLKL